MSIRRSLCKRPTLANLYPHNFLSIGFSSVHHEADIWTAHNNNREKHANVYRHPHALRDPTTEFKKVHDYYSFGVIMFEIACWRPLDGILQKFQELRGEECREEDVKRVQAILLDKNSVENYPKDIAFRMGEIYKGVLEKCLTGTSIDDQEVLEAFKKHVIDELGRCVI